MAKRLNGFLLCLLLITLVVVMIQRHENNLMQIELDHAHNIMWLMAIEARMADGALGCFRAYGIEAMADTTRNYLYRIRDLANTKKYVDTVFIYVGGER